MSLLQITPPALSGPQTLDGLLTVGSGDNQQIFPAQAVTTALGFKSFWGTAASPDTGVVPVVRVVRTQEVTTGVLGDGSEQLAAGTYISVGTASTKGQPVGLFGGASTSSTQSSDNDDASGGYFVGRILATGTGIGIGSTFLGRSDSASGKADASQMVVYNGSGSAGTYNSTGRSGFNLIWGAADGADASVAFAVGNPNGYQFEYGLAVPAQVTGGKTGGVKTALIRDDGNAVNSIILNGTHSGYGIDFKGGTFTLGPIRLANNVAVVARNAADGADVSIWKFNASNEMEFPAANRFSNLLRFSAGVNMTFASATGTKIGTATNELIAFHNATPVGQRAGAAQAAVATTAATNVTPYGFTTAAQADALVTLVNELRAFAVEKGLIKGAA